MDTVITQIGAVVIALIATYQAIRLEKMRKEGKRKDTALVESSRNFSALSLLVDFELISSISKRVDDVFHGTKVDRFLLLIAVNGKEAFNVVSVVYERHKSSPGRIDLNATGRYSHIQIDAAYKQMLQDVENKGSLLINTDDLPADSLLRNIYETENVTASTICKLVRLPIDQTKDMLLFCSYATHSNDKIPQKEHLFIRTMHGAMKSAFDDYSKKIDSFVKLIEDE